MRKYLLPLCVTATVLTSLLFGSAVPVIVKQGFYAFSLTTKEILVFFLPFIIAAFLFRAILAMHSGALTFLLSLIIMIAASNFLAINIGYIIASEALPRVALNLAPVAQESTLNPLWTIKLKNPITNELAMCFASIYGLYYTKHSKATNPRFAMLSTKAADFFLKKMFLPILPLFIFGFILKLEHEGALEHLFEVYGQILILIVFSQIAYCFFLYLLAAELKPLKAFEYVRNMLPAIITAFSTISSAATMPVTMMCSERNVKDKSLIYSVVPATANTHTLGSAIGLTIMALGTMMAFGVALPSYLDFLMFALFYTIAKFGVAGIPGGVVIAVSPLLERYLGFSPEMIGAITAIYMLFDPFGTATNVACNGTFVILFNNLRHKSSINIQKELIC